MSFCFLKNKAIHRWLFIMAAGLSFSIIIAVQASEKQDILCENTKQGYVEELPKKVQDWVLIICTEVGQALSPGVGDGIAFWITHEKQAVFLLQAFPFGKKLPDGVVAEDIRFTRFAVREMTGESKFKTLKMWELGFGRPPSEEITEIYQLSTQSSFQGIFYHLFFYLENGKPEWLIVCLENCQRSVQVDILY
ncbi:MAG: hypothetical protein NXI13_01675 [Proteobacteria bacterium]|nr:hypothetical protein [Pseudomonadota bacterium]